MVKLITRSPWIQDRVMLRTHSTATTFAIVAPASVRSKCQDRLDQSSISHA